MADTPWRHLDLPALVAHRGYALRYPENTLVALAAAVARGARFLEFDLQLSRDEVPILCHDENFERVGGHHASVFDLAWHQLRDVGVGEPRRFGTRFEGVTVSSLDDAIRHLNRWPATISFIEIKRQSVARFGVETTVDRVLSVLGTARRPYVIISFDAAVVAYARGRGCRQIGWVLPSFDAKHRDGLTALAPDYVFCNGEDIPAKAPLWRGSWHWAIYEVRTAEAAAGWRRRGSALIESMAAGELLPAAPFMLEG